MSDHLSDEQGIPVVQAKDQRCRCFQMPHERGDRTEHCRHSLTDAEEALFTVVRRYTADTREKRDWPRIADEQAVKIVLGLSEAVEAAERALVERVEAVLDETATWIGGWTSRDSGQVCNAEGVQDLVLDLRAALAGDSSPVEETDLVRLLTAQREWSTETFGPGDRYRAILDHLHKELLEVRAEPRDVEEWIDVAILAFDGAWRTGAGPEQVVAALRAKYAKNRDRSWPDWRTADPNKAIEHVETAGDSSHSGTGGEARPASPAVCTECEGETFACTSCGAAWAQGWCSGVRSGWASQGLEPLGDSAVNPHEDCAPETGGEG